MGKTIEGLHGLMVVSLAVLLVPAAEMRVLDQESKMEGVCWVLGQDLVLSCSASTLLPEVAASETAVEVADE